MHNWKDSKAEADAIHEAHGTQAGDERKAAIREALEGRVRAYRLAEIREEQALTQTDVAKAMGTTQSNVSRFERGELGRSELATIAAYVEALGGTLRLVADFGDRQLRVS
ncbi:helix-turn-helix domain-containing protein [Streptomyces cocklensis]|jgi:DNA-binding transcriptional regulator YiaG|uniref:Antitoxin HigA3 n=1 Tax=Actinacidiphila cocklensis TaxID=887465 RepID=A0A9W4DYG0_9ACTN|nr:helix-turn-helix domain-containing protein [Actinacidiphila cocklensis]MDD1056820.1 helix-turn-helix domain-containing protein [Actinacidiphila cocklensis]CAG6397696.1 Putative antitoxin HigA3 [Actinacidiphila cocklensis]